MPVEIINLISSPDVSHSAAAPRTEALPPTRPSRPPARAIDYDILDLTGDVSNRHASSPPAASGGGGGGGGGNPSLPLLRRPSGFPFFSSDDNDDLAFDVLDDAQQPAKKRPRLETRTSSGPGGRNLQGNKDQVPAGRTRRSADEAGPGVLRPACARRWHPNVDPIQTSSDPFASSPPPHKEKGGPWAGHEDKENIAGGGDHLPLPLEENEEEEEDDDDPFASSPRPPAEGKDKGKGKQTTALEPLAGRHVHVPSSPIFVSSQPRGREMAGPERRSGVKGRGKTLEWDHISSSAPEAERRDDWDLDLGLDMDTHHPPRVVIGRSRSGGVDDFDLGDLLSGSDDGADLPDLDGGDQPSRPGPSSRGRPAGEATRRSYKEKTLPVKKSTAEKNLDRLDRAAAKEAERRRRQREKEEAKERRRRDKERAAALAEVNRARIDKKVSTPEMIVDVPSSLDPAVKAQVEALLGDLQVESHSYASPVRNVVKWRRKVRARFDEDEGHWEPAPERVEDEQHAMVVMGAAELVGLALGNGGGDLEAHVLEMRRHYGHHTIIYLIEGLASWMRKNRSVRNRQFQSAVRSAGGDEVETASIPPVAAASGASGGGGGSNSSSSSSSTGRRSRSGLAEAQTSKRQRKKKDPKPPAQYMDEDALEDALLRLQVDHGALIHHTAAAVETAQWVAIFTQHISTIPYRRQRDAVNASAGFCMDSGQVRTGDGARDTYARMLQEMARVTAPIAWGVAAAFGSVRELVRGLERQGPLALEGIRRGANKDGAYTDRTVGQAVSRRMHKVFTGRDETSTDI